MSVVPFDKREGKIWFNGELVDWQAANIHVLHHSLHYGSCVFEGIRIYDGRAFKLQEHIERLFKSAELLGYKITQSLEEVIAACELVISENQLSEGYLRPFAWLGAETMNIAGQGCKTHVAVAGWKTFEDQRKAARQRGQELLVSSWRKPTAGCTPYQSKAAGHYMMSSVIKNDALAAGFGDALILDTSDYITEAPVANFFFYKDGVLCTPEADCFLNGITRQTVMQLALDQGIAVEEGKYRLADLDGAEAAFLTGTATEITPVRRIATKEQEWYFDKDHEIVVQLMAGYAELALDKVVAIVG
jgi:branched-chain amino acid aminotransferase